MSSEIDARALRRALGNFATGVTVITAQNTLGEKVGLTANSFNSVSLDPPLILWSLDKNARSMGVFDAASHFAVNILSAEQINLSNHFSRQQEDKFAGVDWREGEGGCPLLSGCAGSFQCEAHSKIDAGDHYIYLGKVLAFDDPGRPPLFYHRGSYSMIAAHPGLAPQAEMQAGQGGHRDRARLSENVYFLMLQALQTYQSSYLPRQEALGVSITEARAIFLLSDNPELFADGLPRLDDMPQSDVSLTLDNLVHQGFVAPVDNGFSLTELGQAKARELWDLAHAHADLVFQSLEEGALQQFKTTLRGVAKVARAATSGG
jgi:4-hydroxyphenylacetate 3-hydroxylase, reductase component